MWIYTVCFYSIKLFKSQFNITDILSNLYSFTNSPDFTDCKVALRLSLRDHKNQNLLHRMIFFPLWPTWSVNQIFVVPLHILTGLEAKK